MESWRESTSEEVQNIMDSLFENGLNAAGNFLAKNKEFYPFASGLTKSGELVPIMAYEGSDMPKSQDLIDLIVQGLNRDKSKYQAIMIVYNIKINKTTDAILVHTEHEIGLVLAVAMPYTFKGLFGKKLHIDMNSAILNEATCKVFN
jgi:hypothetical protein